MRSLPSISNPQKYLKAINNLLLATIIGVNSYILTLTIYPFIETQIRINITRPVTLDHSNISSATSREMESIYIPSIQLEEQFYEGTNSNTTYKGVWRLPRSSTPDEAGNTVMVGHRFSYKKPEAATFYSLDLIKKRDDIYVVYKHKLYQYKVNNILTVTPDTISIELPTNEPTLTLYTCTPLWSTSHRLVIQARLIKVL